MIRITKVQDLGDDVLYVEGVLGEDMVLSARGWVSAMTNHFDEDAEGNRTYRMMTRDEKVRYCKDLLLTTLSQLPKDLEL